MPKPDSSSTPQAALITGGATRVGRVIALTLAEAGYDIVLHYNTSHSAAEETAEAISATGRRCSLLQQDLSVLEGLDSFMHEAFRVQPALTTLINNASIFERTPFEHMTQDDLTRHMTINLHSPVFLMQHMARHARSGHIINIVDNHVTQRQSPFFAYLLSKKGLLEASFMAAADMAPGFQVNAVCPGIVLPSDGFDETYMNHKSRSLPQQRTATPQEVANTVHMLLGSSLTGQCLYVDGGEQLTGRIV